MASQKPCSTQYSVPILKIRFRGNKIFINFSISEFNFDIKGYLILLLQNIDVYIQILQLDILQANKEVIKHKLLN